MAWFNWSRTAATNANADPTINWAEGQSPSSVNDSARAMMAATAKYRDDIAGAIVTGGTSTAYTVTSYSTFDTLAHMDGQMIAFTPHATNGATVTLNVDALGAKPLRSAPSVELPSNALILGTPYVATYNNTDGVWYLHGFTSPYSIPLGAGMDFWGTTAPNSCFAFPSGQAISRTTYATLYAIFGTTYGSGDGSTTFNLPDKTGRVSAMKEASATRLTGSYFGGTSSNLGAVGGDEKHFLNTGELPAHTHSGTTGGRSTSHVHSGAVIGSSLTRFVAGGSDWSVVAGFQFGNTNAETTDHTHSFTTSSVGFDNAHANVQPTIVCNYIIRIV